MLDLITKNNNHAGNLWQFTQQTPNNIIYVKVPKHNLNMGNVRYIFINAILINLNIQIMKIQSTSI